MKKQYGPYVITLSNLHKKLLGAYTKGDLIKYYEAIATKMIPLIKDHPLMMHRFPDGLEGESFYQKDASSYFPDWIKKVTVEKKDGTYTAVLCQNKATLVYLANQACITPHIWLSAYDKVTIPDRLIFDLDPSDKDFSKVRLVAQKIKVLLDKLNLISFVMSSGSKGLHIYIPLYRSVEFEKTKAFAQACAEIICKENPEIATLALRKDQRGSKVFIDTLRNQQGATAVAPYAVRALKAAPIATPLFWKEVDDPQLSPQKFTIKTIFDRLASQSDPWHEYRTSKQSLTTASKKLGLM